MKNIFICLIFLSSCSLSNQYPKQWSTSTYIPEFDLEWEHSIIFLDENSYQSLVNTHFSSTNPLSTNALLSQDKLEGILTITKDPIVFFDSVKQTNLQGYDHVYKFDPKLGKTFDGENWITVSNVKLFPTYFLIKKTKENLFMLPLDFVSNTYVLFTDIDDIYAIEYKNTSP